MSKSVLFRAPVLTASGYGVHARQIARWLFDHEKDWDLDISVELLNWGTTGWIVDTTAFDGLVGRCLQASTGPEKFIHDVTIQLQLPNEWNPSLGLFNVGMTAGVETDRCNPAWVQAVNMMNLVIVPSQFTKECFERSGTVTTPIVVVPEAFTDEVETGTGSIDLDLTTDFNFLVFGQITGNNPDNDRKNIAYTVKWMSEAFKDRPDVGVILKTNVSRNSKLDASMTTSMLSKLIAEVKQGPGPKFYLLHGELSSQEVAGLYTHPKVKALVTLTHGEGYGLPILEAAASGLPVIAPGWSGHMEFLKHGKFVKLEHRLAPVHESRVDNQIFMKDVCWAFTFEQDVKQRLVKFVGNDATPKAWAAEMKQKLLPLYNFKAIAKEYDNTLKSCFGF